MTNPKPATKAGPVPKVAASPGPATDGRKRLGTQGERWVVEALVARGFRILATNYRTRWGEIDAVACRERAVWIVEVKTRRSDSFGPVEVSRQQQQRLTRMAYRFLQDLREPYDSVQFAVALVSFVEGTPRIDWIEQAFESAF